MTDNTVLIGGELMRALATKLISILIIYFAGFATAIYMLAPVPKSQARQPEHAQVC